MALESGERVVVGVNRYREGDDPEPASFQVDPALAGGQIARLAAVRAARDGAAVEASLQALRADCERPEVNALPAIVDAVRARATLGEICGAMRDVVRRVQAGLIGADRVRQAATSRTAAHERCQRGRRLARVAAADRHDLAADGRRRDHRDRSQRAVLELVAERAARQQGDAEAELHHALGGVDRVEHHDAAR